MQPCGVRVIMTCATHQMNGSINPRMFQEGRCYKPEIFAGLMSYRAGALKTYPVRNTRREKCYTRDSTIVFRVFCTIKMNATIF